MSKNPPHLGNIEDDPIGLDREMTDEILRTAIQVRAKSDDPMIWNACDVIEGIAREGVELRTICKTRIALERMIEKSNPEALAKVRADIEHCIQRLQEHTLRRRDARIPLMPDRIIPYPTTLFNGAPWYLAEYRMKDPRWGNPVHEPHLAFIRTREHIVGKQEDLSRERIVEAFENKVVPIRVHSECLLGDMAYSGRCDCGHQKKAALLSINEQEEGVFLYLRQEGRGIGLHEKLKALELQDGRKDGKHMGTSFDTAAAMTEIGHDDDSRDFGVAAKILRGLGVSRVSIMTHNQAKIAGLEGGGIEVVRKETASGVAVTVENLTELLWKILHKGYRGIKWESIAIVEREIERLRAGDRINDHLYALLREVLDIIDSGEKHDIPDKLVEAVNGARERLSSSPKAS